MKTAQFNPYTGRARHPSDIKSDPEGRLIVDPGAPLMAAKRPPNARGQGRKPLDKGGELMRSRPVRMTDAQWEKCKRLGGASFLRNKIDKARE